MTNLPSTFSKVMAVFAIILGADFAFAHGSDGHDDHAIQAPIPKGKKQKRLKRFSVSVGLAYADRLESTPSTVQNTNGAVQTHSANEESEEHGHDHKESHGLGSPSFGLGMRYLFSRKLEGGLSFASNTKDGLEDPSATLGYTTPLTRRTTLRTAAFATAPLSRESSETALMTTVGPQINVSYRARKVVLSSGLSAAFSYFQKKNEAGSASHSSEDDHHEGEEHSEGEQHSEDSHDNELSRIAGSTNLTFLINRFFSIGAGAELSRGFWQVDAPTWATTATITRVGVQYQNVAANLALAFRTEDHDIFIPERPLVRMGAQVTY